MDVKEQFLGHRKKEVDTDTMEDLSEVFEELAEELNRLPESREKSLCLTKLEEAHMWAMKCIALRVDAEHEYIVKM